MIRYRTNLSDVLVSVNGTNVPVLYAGPAPVLITVTDGFVSNTVTIAI